MNQCKEFERKIDFQFTAVPSKLMTALDVNCRSMLFILCQLSDYYADENGVLSNAKRSSPRSAKLRRNAFQI